MNNFLKFAIGLLCTINIAQADQLAPDELIKNTVQEVTGIIKQDKDILAGNQQKILALVDAKVLPHFDFDRMTRLAVGKYWRTATPEQKQALVGEFRSLLVRTYTRALSVYRDEVIEVKPVKVAADTTEVTIRTDVIKPGTQPVPVNYEMEKTADGWKAYDLSIEGVSLVTNYRSTFGTAIQQNGIDGLIKILADKNSTAEASGKAAAK
ncbi:MAG TPA: ABC transporter substrate-binding protein [Gallionella sp.]|nr:ABC transporter substrate-binding protein [Gallionella sp.]